MRYKGGQAPEIGDAVKGIPNGCSTAVAALVNYEHEGLLSLVSIVPIHRFGDGVLAGVRQATFFGEANNFELLARG